MGFAVVLIFSLIAAVALAFVCWPLWRHAGKGRPVLAASLACFVLAVAAGSYILVGHPRLAERSFETPNDVPALVSMLAWRMRSAPANARGWALLGRGYLSLNDPVEAAGAFRRAAALAPAADKPALYSAYGEALTAAAMGEITPEAEAAFRQALAGDPKDVAARFYLGQAYAMRRDVPHALALWQSLLADTPPDAPWRQMLLSRIVMLRATAQGAPNVVAMVEGLAERLKAHPNDPVGWRRLVRAYVVLGQRDKAEAALENGRRALQGADRSALDAEADELKL